LKDKKMAEAAVAENVEQQTQAPQDDSRTQAKAVDFAQATESKVAGPGSSIDILLDMEVPVSVVLGKVNIPIQRFLQLGPGSVLKLEKPIEEPADLYLKDTKFAVGTIVVVEDQFAIRIKEVLGAAASSSQAAKK
jgi:flagellar motor switch protein FliN/FliY